MKSLLANIATLFDYIFQKKHLHIFERITIILALAFFVFHLVMIFLANQVFSEEAYFQVWRGSYLSAIYTPYSFILFFEVFLLVLSIPKSFTTSVGKQFEIISLIILRRVFKDISDFHGVDDWYEETETIISVGQDMLAAIILFFLVFLFHFTVQRTNKYKKSYDKEVLTPFINFKKAISLFLSFILLVIAIFHLTDWLVNYLPGKGKGVQSNMDVNAIFYEDLFGLMIFTDVTLLIISVLYTQDFPQVFRNSSFVISTILLRLSFTAEKPLSLIMIMISILFCVLTIWIYGNLEKLTFTKMNKELGDNQEA